MQYSLNYSGTRFLSTENYNYSFSWRIPSYNLENCQGNYVQHLDLFLCHHYSVFSSTSKLKIITVTECSTAWSQIDTTVAKQVFQKAFFTLLYACPLIAIFVLYFSIADSEDDKLRHRLRRSAILMAASA